MFDSEAEGRASKDGPSKEGANGAC